MEIEVTSIEINRNIKIRGIVNSIAFKIKTNLNEKYLSNWNKRNSEILNESIKKCSSLESENLL